MFLLFLLAPLLAAMLPALIGAAGGIFGSAIQRGQSRRDVRDQNAYNTPSAQLARLKEAGLPFAAFGSSSSAGNQSSLPTSGDGGAAAAGNALGNYISTQMQLKQLEILKADIRVKNTQADLQEAEAGYLLSGRGEDRAGTNLTQSLKSRVGLEAAQKEGAEISNRIAGITEKNEATRLSLANSKTIAEIGNMLENKNLIKESVKGAELDNKIKDITLSYKSDMSQAELTKLVLDSGLLREGIKGKELDNAIGAIRYRVERDTEVAQITGTNADALLRGLTFDKVSAEFENYQQYQRFVKMVRDEWDPTNQDKSTLKSRWRALIAMAYTTVTGLSGNSPNVETILNHIK